MTPPRPEPPHLATSIIARLLPLGEREDTLGDLAERFHRHVERSGAGSARRWYWKQVLSSILPMIRVRVMRLLKLIPLLKLFEWIYRISK